MPSIRCQSFPKDDERRALWAEWTQLFLISRWCLLHDDEVTRAEIPRSILMYGCLYKRVKPVQSIIAIAMIFLAHAQRVVPRMCFLLRHWVIC